MYPLFFSLSPVQRAGGGIPLSRTLPEPPPSPLNPGLTTASGHTHGLAPCLKLSEPNQPPSDNRQWPPQRAHTLPETLRAQSTPVRQPPVAIPAGSHPARDPPSPINPRPTTASGLPHGLAPRLRPSEPTQPWSDNRQWPYPRARTLPEPLRAQSPPVRQPPVATLAGSHPG